MEGMHQALLPWGWDERWEAEWALASVDAPAGPARVVEQERDRWWVRTTAGIAPARLPQRGRGELHPVTGDWVAVAPGPETSDPLSLLAILPRRTAFVRGAAGDGTPQVLGANLDQVWVVQGLDTPPNLRRIERSLALAWQSGAIPAVILTKADLAEDVVGARAAVAGVAPGVEVEVVNALDDASLAPLRNALTPGRTVVLLGPSGAGKSTLVNALAGEERTATGEVRAGDRKGRHTTTRRSLFQLPGGALVLDTPGIRELRVLELDEGLDLAYPEIEALAVECRFRDCRHEQEPGCAVLAAAERGELDPERLASYRKLLAEAAYEARKSDPVARKAAMAEHRTALKTMRFHPKRKDRE